jgi:TIR domain
MAASPPPKPGRIFISYRRGESAYPAGWLYDRLADHYGKDQVFKDVDDIELGEDFVEVITAAVGSCDVLLALIGVQWLTITDVHGRRRLDDPDDFVRLEIEAALARNVHVIPVLVGGAAMPSAEELPESLARLARRQALELSPDRFGFETSRLLRRLDEVLIEIKAAQAEPDAMPGVPQAAAAMPAAALPEPRRRSGRPWLLAGAGISVVVVLMIIAVLANRGATPSTGGSGAPSTAAGEATRSAPAATIRSPAANEPVLLRDDFSSRAAGWAGDGAVAKGAGYTGGAYRISAPSVLEGSGAGSVPKKASRVWPSAPPSVRIAVEGRRVPESDKSMGMAFSVASAATMPMSSRSITVMPPSRGGVSTRS